jgi:hypothetical protein
MRNDDTPPGRTGSVRKKRWLSVTSAGMVALALGSLVLWHGQVGELFGLAGDEEPVVSSVNAPAVSGPPPATAAPRKPARTPATTPTRKPSRKPTKSAEKPSYDEESIDGLSPTLKSRLTKAMAAAKRDGVTLEITSGRRSAAKQQRLLNEAIQKYGSYEAATRWVLPPKYSAHVQGKAVDIGPAAAMRWLDKNGWRYGICRRYDNEPWHFEALTRPGTKCPPREPYSRPVPD